MSREALDVFWNDDETPIGQVVQDQGATTFRYAALAPPTRRISHSLPVDASRTYPITFFENLLPDGVQRERLALGTSRAQQRLCPLANLGDQRITTHIRP